jgi:hypothetical protein
MVIALAMLAAESGSVVALRTMKLMWGGSEALYEADGQREGARVNRGRREPAGRGVR